MVEPAFERRSSCFSSLFSVVTANSRSIFVDSTPGLTTIGFADAGGEGGISLDLFFDINLRQLLGEQTIPFNTKEKNTVRCLISGYKYASDF